MRVALKDAEKAKDFLRAGELLASGALAFRQGSYFFLPLSAKPAVRLTFAFTLAEKNFEESARGKSFRQVLVETRTLSASDAAGVSFDVVGDIAVLELPPRLKKKQAQIAFRLLRYLAPRAKTVAVKKTFTRGKYRIRKIRVVAGVEKTATAVRENGCSFKVDLNKAYFNARLAAERLRVSSLARPRENILVLFAGVGPFAIEIAKRQPSARVVGVELNPVAVKFFNENLLLNKVRNVEIIEGDAASVLRQKRFRQWADRIVMPLPKEAKKFLLAAVNSLRERGVIHYYSIASELADDVFAQAAADAEKACAKAGRKFVFVAGRKVIPYAPRVAQVAVDFRVL